MDLVNATDIVAIDDAWMYALIAGSFAEYYSLWDDTRKDETKKDFQEVILEMIKSYGTRAGAVGTFEQAYKDLAGDLGMWSKNGVDQIKGAINDACAEILTYQDWEFNKVRDAVVVGDGGYVYTLASDCRKPVNVRVGSDKNVTGLEKKDLQWINYSIEMKQNIATQADARPTHFGEQGFDGSGSLIIKINQVIPAGVLVYYDYVKSFTAMSTDEAVIPLPKDFLYVLKTVALPYITGTLKDVQIAEKTLKQMRMSDFKNEDNDVSILRGRNNVK